MGSSSWQNDEIDLALALSLAGEDDDEGHHSLPTGGVDTNGDYDEDEVLARALQESLNIDPRPQQPVVRKYTDLEPLKCHACRGSITDYMDVRYDQFPYHRNCFPDTRRQQCGVCGKRVYGGSSRDSFWPQKLCSDHWYDGTARCCSCGIMESKNASFAPLDEGRTLCYECLDSAVMDTLHCEPLYIDIQEFYEAIHMKLPQQVPMLVVERQALNEARSRQRHGDGGGEVQGICMAEVYTVDTIMEQPRGGSRGRPRTVPYQLSDKCEVTAILVLYGLPRLRTGAILAHEMMHAWLRLQGCHTLRSEIEEGICNVMARIWLESEVARLHEGSSSSSSESFEKKLSVYFIFRLFADPSPVYGDGFRKCNAAVVRYGLKRTLDSLLQTNNLPF